MGPSPLLSIVIPTRNRLPFAINVIESILRMPDPDLELIVQDNSDSRELESFVQTKATDRRLRYQYTPPPLSSIGNFNAAMSLATGRYVCLIGDDDGVNPEIVEAARWAEATGLDVLTPLYRVDYRWPGASYSTHFRTFPGATLSIFPFSGELTFPDPKAELRKLVDQGGVPRGDIDLPKLYHGIVKRSCLECIRDTTGHYFGGLSPDLYASVAVALVADRTARIDYPLTIGGACPASTSAAASSGKHTGRLEDAPHWRDRSDYQWSDLVPRFYSVDTIWAEAVVAALTDMQSEVLLRMFDVSHLTAFCLARHPQFARTTLKNFYRVLQVRGDNRWIGSVRLGVDVFCGPFARLLKRVANRVRVMLTGAKVDRIRDVPDIVAAQHALSHHLSERGHTFSRCVRGKGG